MCVIKQKKIMRNLSEEYSNISATPVSRNMRHSMDNLNSLHF